MPSQNQIPTKTLSFYIPSTSNVTLKKIKEFFSTESDVCVKAKEIANILSANKKNLKSKFKDIDEVIQLYNNLSINFFDFSTSFFNKIYLNDSEVPSVEDWIRSIYEVVNSAGYQRRLKLLKEATVKYPLWNKTVAEIIDSKMLSEKDRGSLKLDFSIPIHRILRMKMLFCEIQEKYSNENEETSKQLKQLNTIFEAHTAHLNNSVGNLETNEPSPPVNKRQRQHIPKGVVQYFRENENSVNNDSFLQFLEEHSKKNSLTLSLILNELKKIAPDDPQQQLIKLERAFGGIRMMPATSDQKREAVHFLRKNFLYTDAQLKQIALLKTAYLTIVANTPRVENSPFEQYLEAEYPKTATAEDGGLLAFNTTCVSWFVKTKEKTTSMKTLEALKKGGGRIDPDPEHKRAVIGLIVSHGRVFSAGFS